MGWSGSLTSDSPAGTSITFTPDTRTEGAYTVSLFTAPKKGVYQFILNGSSGTYGNGAGGAGGATLGYLLLEKDESICVSAGGTCSASYVCALPAVDYDVSQFVKLSYVPIDLLYFVAGAGGAGGSYSNVHDPVSTAGGNGGGDVGANGGNYSPYGNSLVLQGGGGGTQSGGGVAGSPTTGSGQNGTAGTAGSYGKGGAGASKSANGGWGYGGRGGDGYYGGGGGCCNATHNSGTGERTGWGIGGGGGSGYVKNATLTVGSTTYTSLTAQGIGAAGGGTGSVVVTYYANADIPVIFNGTQLEKLIYNGVEIEHLIYNGAQLFIERVKKFLNGVATPQYIKEGV